MLKGPAVLQPFKTVKIEVAVFGSPHPPVERLVEFGLGRVSVEESTAIEHHIESCETCRERVETTADDDFIFRIRDALPTISARLVTRTDYRHLRVHAKGGLGEVTVVRDEAFGRDVAIKRLLPHAEGRDVLRARFLREARVTARLEHPGIVPVYGIGEDEAGRPCYAMRFVPGDTLAGAIRDLHATGRPTERAYRSLLARFVALCGTVAYAHSRGVVHRDIKPNNVAIGPFGETILLDWGLAQVPNEPDPPVEPQAEIATPTGDGELTATGTVLGTPGFLAPEQAAGGAVGPAADLFSLGVTLRMLLTGRWPHERPDPEARPPAALLAIADRATAADPAARYADAMALAADVERWLADEPVAAHRDPWAARVKRFVRHHAAATAAAVSLLAVSVVGLAVGALLVDRERGKTRDALADKTKLAESEAVQRAHAETKEKESAAVLSFADQRIFGAGRPKGRDGGLGRDVSLAQAIAAAEPFVAESFKDQPLVEARVRTTLGRSFQQLGNAKSAEPQYRRALELSVAHRGEEHPDTLTARSNVAANLWALGKPDAARVMDEETLARRRRILGDDHPDTLRSMNNLSNAYSLLGRDDDALRLDRETYDRRLATLGPEHPDTLVSMNGLGSSLTFLDRHDEAYEIQSRAMPLLEKVFGPDDPTTLTGRNNLANTLGNLGRHREALDRRIDVHERMSRVNGPDHPNTLMAMNNIARSRTALKDFETALAMHREILAKRRTVLGEDHGETFVSIYNVVNSLIDLDRGSEAVPLIDAAVVRGRGLPINPNLLPALLERRGRIFRAKKDVTQCRATDETATAIQRNDADMLYLLAALASMTVAAGGDDRDAERAVGRLRAAVAAGFSDRKKIDADPDFDPIRSRTDFQSLVNAIPKPATSR